MELTPKQTEALQLVQTGKFNFVLYGGAIRGGKTIWGLSVLLILCELFPRSRWAVVRKDNERIRKTTIPSFLKLESTGRLKQSPYEYIHHNESVILFLGENYDRDKELDAFKGLEVNGFLFEEINECQEKTLNKAFERSGAWIIPKSDIQPKPIILATCNPSNGWIKERVYNKWKNNSLPIDWAYVPAKITDNPYLPDEYVKSLKNLPQYEYEVFVNGNWDIQLKTGGEFLKQFEINKHVKPVRLNKSQTLHFSIDNNVYPYIAISVWQIEGNNIIQVDEITAKDPNNTASKAGELVVKYLSNIDYENTVFVYGDQTTTSRNTIDDNKKSFLDLFIDKIRKHYSVQKRIPSGNPPVALSGDYINAIYEKNYNDLNIIIGENCKESINDYILTKQDKDGSILKKRVKSPEGISYEESGHILDTKRYFICEAFKNEFNNYKRRFDSSSSMKIGRSYTDRNY